MRSTGRSEFLFKVNQKYARTLTILHVVKTGPKRDNQFFQEFPCGNCKAHNMKTPIKNWILLPNCYAHKSM